MALFCHGISLEKNYVATWALEPASHVSVNSHASFYTIRLTPKKKDACN